MAKSKAQLDREIASALSETTNAPRPSKAEHDKERTRLHGRFNSGDKAWAIIAEGIGYNAKGKNRRTIVGAAQVRVDDGRGDRIRATIVRGSPAYLNGQTHEFQHQDVYADTREGRLAFQRSPPIPTRPPSSIRSTAISSQYHDHEGGAKSSAQLDAEIAEAHALRRSLQS